MSNEEQISTLAVTEEQPKATVLTLLRELHENSLEQTRCAKKQLRMMRIFTASAVLMLATVLCVCALVLPQVSAVLTLADGVMVKVSDAASNLEGVSEELAQADLSGILQNVDGLVKKSDEGITQALSDTERALKVLEEVDIKTLNQSIRDLHSVIGPLARFFGKGS